MVIMDIKDIIDVKERENIISNLKKEIDILESKNKVLKYDKDDLEIFYSLQSDLLNDDFSNIEAYIKIKEIGLFDYDFYINEYNYSLNADPLLHYIYKGYLENKNPNKNFDGVFYSTKYPEIKDLDMNPLVFFVLYGQFEGKTLINKNIHSRNCINKHELDKVMDKFYISGINNVDRNFPNIIVSLTSFPERIYDVHYCIFSLLNQKFKPDKVVLWLAEEEFPNKERDLSIELLALKNNGLTIKWCENLFSYKKLIPSLREYPNDIIVTADDDLYYPEDWLESLYEDYLKYPNCIISNRSRKIVLDEYDNLEDYSKWYLLESGSEPSFLNFSTNGAGTLFPPNSLNKTILDSDLFSELCPSGDDIWIWAMAILNKTKIKVLNNGYLDLIYVNLAREDLILNENVLWAVNVRGDNNNIQINKVINHFPKIKDILLMDK